MLKMKDADLARLRAAIEPLDKQEHRDRYLAGNFRNADACKDKDMRYRWDLLYASGLKIGDGVGRWIQPVVATAWLSPRATPAPYTGSTSPDCSVVEVRRSSTCKPDSRGQQA